MKNIILATLIAFACFASSCNPLDETYKELDATAGLDLAAVAGINDTITSSEYKDTLGVLKFKDPFFSSDVQAKALIPLYLTKKYPWFAEGSIAQVTYNLYDSVPIYNDTVSPYKNLITYKLANGDYTNKYHNFSSTDDAYTFLNKKYPDVAEGTLVSLTYNYYSGGVTTLNNGFLKFNNKWIFARGFSEDEYKAVGHNYSNFSGGGEAKTIIPIYLKELYKYETIDENTVKSIMYNLYLNKKTIGQVINYVYKNGAWTEYKNVLVKTLQFKLDKTVWATDNTIIETLTADDYIKIGNHFATVKGYEKKVGGLIKYKDFSTGTYDSDWSDLQIGEALIYYLNDKHPTAKEGQKYKLIVDIYKGGHTLTPKFFIKKDGKWIVDTDADKKDDKKK